MNLGVALGWHAHPWETLLGLVTRAEELGFSAAFVDGDISMLDSSRKTDVLNGWTVTTALLAHTRRIQIGSIRLVHHWNAAQLAQAVATAEQLAPGRLRFLISIGDRPHDERFGLPGLSRAERICWLDETLSAVRGLWRGEVVTCRGQFVQLDGARVQPTPPAGRIPIAVAGKGPKLLEVVAAHADIWEINLPPIAALVKPAVARLEAACRSHARDPGEISRSMWIFTRVQQSPDPDATLAEYRRLNPWFRSLSDRELADCLVVGSSGLCGERLAAFSDEFGLDLTVADLSGLDAEACHGALEALAPHPSRRYLRP